MDESHWSHLQSPKGMTVTQAQLLCEGFENVSPCETEADMLKQFLNLIEDVDVLSGWNQKAMTCPT